MISLMSFIAIMGTLGLFCIALILIYGSLYGK